jgi:DNA ligase-1
MAKLPEINYHGGKPFDHRVWDVLDALATRRITGNAAKALVTAYMEELDEKSATLLGRIITKDLKAGFSEDTINRAAPGTIYIFDCMLAEKFSEVKKKLTFPVAVEPKLDGVRVLAFINQEDQSVKFYSRSGQEFTTFDHLKAPLLISASSYRGTLMGEAGDLYDKEGGPSGGPDGSQIDESFFDECYAILGVDEANYLVLDGEVVSGDFNKTVGDVRRKSAQATDAKFCVFDVFTKDQFDTPSTEKATKDMLSAGVYKDRRKTLEKFYSTVADADKKFIVMLPSILANNDDEVHSLYDQFQAKGLEGAIVKDLSGHYYRKRHFAWSKLKSEESVDCEIVDLQEGEDKYVGMLGAFIVDYKGVRVNVGSGLSDELRASVWPEQGNVIGRVIEVKYHEETPDGSLRHPVFKRFRDDKKV